LSLYLFFSFLPSSLFLPPFLSSSFAPFLPSLLPSHSIVPVRLLNTSIRTFISGRLLSYSDTQRYRLGVNHLQLPVNCPFVSPGVTNYQRDGHDAIYNQDGAPNYYPKSFGGPHNWPFAAISQFSVSGNVARWGCFQCVLMYHVELDAC
jgi:catalase